MAFNKLLYEKIQIIIAHSFIPACSGLNVPIVLSRFAVLKLKTEVSVSCNLCCKFKNVTSMYAINKRVRCLFLVSICMLYVHTSAKVFFDQVFFLWILSLLCNQQGFLRLHQVVDNHANCKKLLFYHVSTQCSKTE